jgi:peptidylprolyl isomerase
MIQNGNKVKVHYTGKIGENVFDSSVNKEPIEFTVGSKQVIEGFENAVLGKNIGDKVSVKIEPNEGYGVVNNDLIFSVDRNQVPPDVQVGQTLQGVNPDGMPFNVAVTDIQESVVILDANHPLAGQTLEFDIEIVSFE